MNDYEYILGSVRNFRVIEDALRAEADYIVIGRPIIMSGRISDAIGKVYEECEQARIYLEGKDGVRGDNFPETGAANKS